jgi:hypothetical protein
MLPTKVAREVLTVVCTPNKCKDDRFFPLNHNTSECSAPNPSLVRLCQTRGCLVPDKKMAKNKPAARIPLQFPESPLGQLYSAARPTAAMAMAAPNPTLRCTSPAPATTIGALVVTAGGGGGGFSVLTGATVTTGGGGGGGGGFMVCGGGRGVTQGMVWWQLGQ